MTQSTCPVCGSQRLTPTTTKFGVPYWSCGICDALFSEPIASDVLLTQNSNPEGRASAESQQLRIQRLLNNLTYRPSKILDFGCGLGDYVNFARNLGFEAIGVDQNTEITISDFPDEYFDAINMVEVIEHLEDPVDVMEKLTYLLKPDGVIYIESSFVDFLGSPAESTYVDPRIGHCCIHSLRSMDYLRWRLRMSQGWLNRNVCLLFKGKLPQPAGR